MIVLQIEHKVPNFEGWKKAFDDDPIDRKKSGVKSYRICRKNDEPNYVVIDLEFDNLNDAQTALSKLKNLWNKVEGTVLVEPKTRILDVVGFTEY
jgi:ribosomal protein L35AE/L33A